MNDTGVIDNFLAVFSTYIDSGFGLLGGEVGFLSSTLIVIDITIAALFWAWGTDEDVLQRLVKKTLYIGVFAFIIGNFQALATILLESFAGLGLKAAGSAMAIGDFMRPGMIASTGLDAAEPLLDATADLVGPVGLFTNFVQILILLIAWVIVVIAFFILAVQVFVTILEFKLVTLAGFVLLPFAFFGRTAFMAERVLGHIISSGIKLLVLAVIHIHGEWPNEANIESVLPTWMLRTDLSNYKPKALAAAGYSRESFGSPSQAVTEYLFNLFTDRQAVVWERDEQRFYVDPDLHARVHNRHDLESTVACIAKDAGHPDPDGFSRRWMRRYNVDGRNPWKVAAEGGDDFRALDKRVRAIFDMSRSYRDLPIVDDLCGLPFQEWRDGIRRKREEKEAAERKRIEDAKESRRRNFAIAAKNALKDEAETWLASTVVDGVPITEWACGSDDLYWRAFSHIERAEASRKRRVLAAEAAEELRKRLTTASNKAFRDPDRARLFLNSAHPKLAGRRPIEACETDADLRVALALLPKT
jgi:P-type conjugative transfer protein TrbL